MANNSLVEAFILKIQPKSILAACLSLAGVAGFAVDPVEIHNPSTGTWRVSAPASSVSITTRLEGVDNPEDVVHAPNDPINMEIPDGARLRIQFTHAQPAHIVSYVRAVDFQLRDNQGLPENPIWTMRYSVNHNFLGAHAVQLAKSLVVPDTHVAQTNATTLTILVADSQVQAAAAEDGTGFNPEDPEEKLPYAMDADAQGGGIGAGGPKS